MADRFPAGEATRAQLRVAVAGDLPALVEIYNHYVTSSPATFDVKPFTTHGRDPWFTRFSESGPYRLWVADLAGRVVGYTSSGEFRAKAAYASSVETTVYVHADFLGRGLGRRLYTRLLDVLESETRVHSALAGITLPNPASVALHEGLGFTRVGTFREVGWKLGRFWDVAWYERRMRPRAEV